GYSGSLCVVRSSPTRRSSDLRGRHEQALAAGLPLVRAGAGVIGQAAAGQVLAIARIRHLRIEAPTLLAGFGIQGDDEIVRRTKVDRKSTRLNSSHVKISYAVF